MNPTWNPILQSSTHSTHAENTIPGKNEHSVAASRSWYSSVRSGWNGMISLPAEQIRTVEPWFIGFDWPGQGWRGGWRAAVLSVDLGEDAYV